MISMRIAPVPQEIRDVVSPEEDDVTLLTPL